MRPLPVLFFIHGGAFVTGGGADYDGAFLAAHGPAVIVTINYRLGPLGFLQLHRHGLDEANNLAISDSLAALDWVHANIENFGGDPDAVTLSGQSAGASLVIVLATLPQAKGKFIRALALSAPGAQHHECRPCRRRRAPRACRASSLSTTPVAIASVPLPKLFAAVEQVGRRIADETASGTVYGPVLDGSSDPARAARRLCRRNLARHSALARFLPRRNGDVPEEHAAGRDDPHHRVERACNLRRCRLGAAAGVLSRVRRASTRIRTKRCCRMRSGIARWPISPGSMQPPAARCG